MESDSSVAICSVTPGESIAYGHGKVVCGRSNCPGFTEMQCIYSDCRVRVVDITAEVTAATMERLRRDDEQRKADRAERRAARDAKSRKEATS